MKYINRTVDSLLEEWCLTPLRKPLLLRGARQVGKTSTVRHLAERFDRYVEINFELDLDVCIRMRVESEFHRKISVVSVMSISYRFMHWGVLGNERKYDK